MMMTMMILVLPWSGLTASVVPVSDYDSGNSVVAWKYDVTSSPSRNATIAQWVARHTSCVIEVAKHYLGMRISSVSSSEGHDDRRRCVVKKILRVSHVTHCLSNGYPHTQKAKSSDSSSNFSPLCDIFVTRTKETTPLFLANVTEVTAIVQCCKNSELSSCSRRVGYVAFHIETHHAVGPRAYGKMSDALQDLCFRPRGGGSKSFAEALPGLISPIAVTLSRPLRFNLAPIGKQQCDGNNDCSSSKPANHDGSSADGDSPVAPPPQLPSRIPFRLLNYNIWNYNGDWMQRARRINRLMDDLASSQAKFMVGYNPSPSAAQTVGSFSNLAGRPLLALPHIVLFQEVRYHNYYQVPPPARGHAGVEEESHKNLRGSKTQAYHLWRNWSSVYNYFHHPAMTYFRLSQGVQIEMEGPMIFQLMNQIGSKDDNSAALSAPTVVELVARMPLRLTRLGRDGDDHQRLLLCGVFLVKHTSSADDRDERLSLRVDICTTHFSLAADAQLLNAMEVANFTRDLAQRRQFDVMPQTDSDGAVDEAMPTGSWQWSNVPAADVTIVAGDLNALPSAACVTYLQSPGKGGGFRDAYHTVDPDGGSAERATQQRCRIYDPSRTTDFALCNGHASDGEADGLTFDSNAESLKKRIDFVLYKAWDWEASERRRGRAFSWDVEVKSLCRLGCKHRLEPVAASDHLALLADLEFVRRAL